MIERGQGRGRVVAIALAVISAVAPGVASASSHREAPAISRDQSADNTDVYAWVSPAHDKLNLIASWMPLEEPTNGPNFYTFDDDVRYEFHVTRGASLDDVIAYRVEFQTPEVKRVDPADLSAPPGGGKEFFIQLTGALGQTYKVTKITSAGEQVIAENVPVAPPNIGPRTQKTANALGLAPFTSPTYDNDFAATFITSMGNEGRVWAGQRDDSFYIDVGAIMDLANIPANRGPVDGLAGFNVHTIALEIPVERVTVDGKRPGNKPSTDTTLGIWASSSRQALNTLKADGEADRAGNWVQVSRLGLPLVNEAIIGYQDKDKYNRTHPKDDVKNFGAYFLNPILVRDAEAVGIYKALGVDPTPFKSNRLDILDAISLKDFPTPGAHNLPMSAIGDVLRIDVALDSAFPNGRPIVPGDNREQADVTDVLLSLILAKGAVKVSDGVALNNCTFLTEFPFLALPNEGFASSHGKLTTPAKRK